MDTAERVSCSKRQAQSLVVSVMAGWGRGNVLVSSSQDLLTEVP